jgi:acetyl-CoA acetyltransferase
MEEGESLSCITPYLARSNGFKGPFFTISTACASGAYAIGIAAGVSCRAGLMCARRRS